MSEFCWRRIRLVVACLVMLGWPAVMSPSKAFAIALPEFTGHTSGQYATVNYAVLSPFDAFAGVLAGAYVPAQGNSGFDASKYTYLYQVASTGSPPINHIYTSLQSEFSNSRPVSTTTIGAFVSGNLRLDFLNGGTIVNATGNNLQGASSLGIAARIVSGPEQIGVLTNPQFSGNQAHPYWTFQGILGSGLTGPLVGYQSTFAPTFSTGFLDGIAWAGPGSIASPAGGPVMLPNAFASSAPEPSTVLLIGSGLLGVMAWRRTKQTRPL